MFCNVRRTTNVSSGNLRVERVERRSARRSAALVVAPRKRIPLAAVSAARLIVVPAAGDVLHPFALQP